MDKQQNYDTHINIDPISPVDVALRPWQPGLQIPPNILGLNE